MVNQTDTFPLYNFGKRSSPGKQHLSEEQGPIVKLDSVIVSKWTDPGKRNLFLYDLKACQTKAVAGTKGFVLQLNEGRHTKKRQTEFRMDKVLQPFNHEKFNFTKVKTEEVLFRFEESESGVPEYLENPPKNNSSRNIVIVNVSPIEFGHILLVPRVWDHIPQRIDPDTLLLAMHMVAEVENPYFRVGYNSLGAFATINHLHFQAYYLRTPFALERALTKTVTGPQVEGGIKVLEVVDYPVRCLIFEIGSSLEELAEEVAKVCMTLQDENQPYNMLITDGGARVFVMPQCFVEKQAKGLVENAILDIRVNPACWEISGHIILFRKEDFEQADEEKAWKLLSEVSLSEEHFDEVKKMCSITPNEMSCTVTVADAFEDDFVLASYCSSPSPMELNSLSQEILPRMSSRRFHFRALFGFLKVTLTFLKLQ